MFDKSTYVTRRENLKKEVESGILLFLGNEEQGLHYADNCFRYRQDSTFLYFFGITTPGLAAVIDIDNGNEILFGDELSMDAIVWMGNQPTLKEKASMAGISTVLPYSELKKYISKAASKGQKIHYLPTYRDEHKIKLSDLLNITFEQINPSVEFIKGVVSLRKNKTEEEIAEIEKACNITAEMHLAAMRALKDGMMEYEIASVVEAAAKSRGAELSFPTIATINGQTLHNHYYGNKANNGRMFLLDAGAEVESGYAGDMSSTFPVAEKFTSQQKEIYKIQNNMHYGAIEALKPGRRFEEVYDLSAQIMVNDMKDLGLMKGDAVEAVKAGAHALFYPHGLGHMMGLDVHDMENLGEVWVGYNGKPKSTQFGRKSLRLARELEPGFVLTIEPGVYFIPELIDMWRSEKRFEEFINYDEVEKYKNFGGIRNEEDYLITDDGSRRLGKRIPVFAEEVEAEKQKA
ncbi:MAG: aminopeptidase P family protein [Bacteroidales bacterium]|nr:aminopeptidase P family protein [Bacteroidales bacterium]